MAVNDTTDIVARLKLDPILNVEVHDTHDAIGREQISQGVDDRVKLGDHR